jgi:hypothetical protein
MNLSEFYMSKLDPFTKKRMIRFVESHRAQSGQLPTLKDFSLAGFEHDTIDMSIKEKVIEQFYVTLSNGSVVKVFKVHHDK